MCLCGYINKNTALLCNRACMCVCTYVCVYVCVSYLVYGHSYIIEVLILNNDGKKHGSQLTKRLLKIQLVLTEIITK